MVRPSVVFALLATAGCGLTLDLAPTAPDPYGRDGALMDAGVLADAAAIDGAASDAVVADGASFDAGRLGPDGSVSDAGMVAPDGGGFPTDGGVILDAGRDAPSTGLWSPAIIFISSAVYSGNLGGLAGADDKCRTAAAGAGLGPGFVAVISDSTTDAMARAPITGEIHDTTGALIAPSASDLWEGRLANAVLSDESGSGLPRTSTAWTGSDLGMAEPYTGMFCSDWMRADAGDTALQGNARARNYSWLYSWDVLCSEPAHLYCIGPGGG